MDEPVRSASIPSPAASPSAGQAAGRAPRSPRSCLPTSAAWWGGFGFLRFHCALFLTGVPFLFLINLILSPEQIWIDRFGLAWLALLVVHAAIVGLIHAIGMLREDEHPASIRETTAQPRSTWITARSAEPQDADFRTASQQAAVAGWRAPSDEARLAAASWQEATPVPATGSLAQPSPGEGGSVWDGWTVERTPSSVRTRSQGTPPPASGTARTPAPASPRPVPEGPGQTGQPGADAEERVSWRKVAEAAWLTPPDEESASGSPRDTTPPAP